MVGAVRIASRLGYQLRQVWKCVLRAAGCWTPKPTLGELRLQRVDEPTNP
jgi:hypothetical protein